MGGDFFAGLPRVHPFNFVSAFPAKKSLTQNWHVIPDVTTTPARASLANFVGVVTAGLVHFTSA
jgi:hypothetical protein